MVNHRSFKVAEEMEYNLREKLFLAASSTVLTVLYIQLYLSSNDKEKQS